MGQPADAPTAGPPVAATVNGDPVYVGEVEAMAAALAKTPAYVQRTPAYVRADALRQLIDRRLGEIQMKSEGIFTDAEVDKELEKLKEQASRRSLTLEQFAASRGVGDSALRHDTAWDIGWTRYLERNLSQSMQDYFGAHHQDYDGTLVRVSHILLRPDTTGINYNTLKTQGEQIREEIGSGKLSFDEAAKKHSDGPSRHRGGDLGFIPRHGVMHETFAQAAFKLDKGQVSPPVISPFGVHLITVTEVRPGAKQWTETIEQLKAPATLELFKELADKQRDSASIEFTGKTPHLKPGTEEVVEAEAAAK